MPRASLTVAAKSPRKILFAAVCTALGVLAPVLASAPASAQTVPAPYDCRSMDPTKWPPSSKPYFMVALDTSGSMNSSVASAPSCSGYPSTRVGHARCALANMVKAYAGEVNFGLSTFPVAITLKSGAKVPGQSCTTGADCGSNVCTGGICQDVTCPNNLSNSFNNCLIGNTWTGSCTSSCGNYGGGGFTCGTVSQTGANQRGADILVPLPTDDYWNSPESSQNNSAALLSWVDNKCGDCKELFSNGSTPLNGVLRDMYRYLTTQWEAPAAGQNADQTPSGSPTYTTPLTGTERSCRSVNVILITDGGETCPNDSTAANAKAAATVLLNGWTIGSDFWTAKTYVIDVGGTAPSTGSNNIAAGGGTTAAFRGDDEVHLSQALSSIISGAVSPETCDNKDNNCNGCIDEGSKLYCNRNRTKETLTFLQTAANNPNSSMCCDASAGAAARTACLAAYSASITAANPQGTTYFLPCWDAATDTTSIETKWLCANPGEVCDEKDNNCDVTVLSTDASFSTNTVDEGQTKCGSPLHCPTNETCNGQDDNCDFITDNNTSTSPPSTTPYSACPNNCKPATETCNGCDDDCNGIIDDGVADIACGFSPPANCAGVRKCTPVTGVTPGSCLPGVTQPGVNEYGACSATPAASDTTCDGLDDNCNGVIDENAPPTACNNGFPGLVYKDAAHPNSQCVMGLQACHSTSCVGWIGPSQEICDGIDNDCDGIVDNNLGSAVGNACGSTTGICTKGTTACVGGVIVCSGAKTPQPEVCNGLDDNCNGQVDEAPLNDGPATPGCWQNAGTACTFTGAKNTLTWSPPTGATCSGLGTLTTPCAPGALVCEGSAGWACVGGQLPTTEVCDGIDNNCNGQTDSTDPSITGTGGVCAPPGTVLGSACQGTMTCTSGKLTCSGGATPSPEICDGKDNDCDGLVDAQDPDLQGVGGICGSSTGTCKQGTYACVSGALVCQGEVKPSAEVCDGLDNNCNGVIDDSPTDTPAALGCWNVAGATCSGGGKTWSPPPGATCTGLGTLTSPCAPGTLVCSGVNKWVCQGGTIPTTETCDGVDNNCNGVVDDGNPGGGGSCGTAPNVLPCKKGTLTCTSGQLLCVGEVGPSTELCDGIDNDCNGTVDDNITSGVGNACGSSTGTCKKGVTACVNASIQCSGGVLPGKETCNGLDDDCDGIVDNNLTDAPAAPGCWQLPGTACTFKNVTWSAPPGATCSTVGSLSAPCTTGTLTCGGTNGWFCQGGLPPSPEICDGKDNNCNSAIDENNPGGGASCGSNVGACKPGTMTCTSGSLVCSGGTSPSPEICDGIDNNCDGQVDEATNMVGLGQICGSNIGTCKAGVMVCDATTHTPVCQGQVPPSPEVCDGKDNDCNGSIDDKPTDTPTNPGCWQNPGTTCSFGTVKWDPPTNGLGQTATCSGLGTLTSPCTPGALICQNGGWTCQGGRLPQATDVCDGVDNDCNGTVDQNNPGGGASCGQSNVGVCKFGTITCLNGTLSCVGEIAPSPEICDNLDNNCNGTVDENAPGSGVPCTGQCSTGLTACIAGTLVCQSSKQPVPEVCNGLDDDCNGLVDDGVLADAPAAGADGCWNVAGTDCSFGTPPLVTQWGKPAGANCSDLGTLSTPCQTGRLRCDGTKGWSCVGGTTPATEICDNKDNDCDGQIDNGNPGGGAACGNNVGTCTFGTQTCVAGVLTCSGVGPTAEVCDGKDNDCDGVIDNGLPLGAPCTPDYDKVAYPGDRSRGVCRPGTLECDPSGSGNFLCKGGIGPSPEICDGKDNDCDGDIDELGAAPNGINGSVDPLNPSQKVGDLCGSSVGECKPGTLGCIGGQVKCTGEQGPQPEICDCKDNNCDGEVDNTPTGATASPLCGAGTACVKDGNNCMCAGQCAGGEFPCPTGYDCKTLGLSSQPTKTAPYCVSEVCAQCPTQTVTSPTGAVQCGPAGTLDAYGRVVPVCECVNGIACESPCATISCDTAGQKCVPSGDFALRCEPSSDCRFFPDICGPGTTCNDGVCVDDPCDPNPCKADEVCKPAQNFKDHLCVKSCASVTCKSNERCVDGVCDPTGCTDACPAGQVCLVGGAGDAGAACGPNPCTPTNGVPVCSDGSFCDPFTGQCITDPCEAVKCPSGQVCQLGECVNPPAQTGSGGAGNGGSGNGGSGTGAGGASGSSGGGASGTGATGAGATTGAGGNVTGAGGGGQSGATGQTKEASSREVVGLATGGGGCRCDLPARGTSNRGALGLVGLLVTVLATRRRARKEGGAR